MNCKHPNRIAKNRNKHANRRGVAAMEAAVVLPLFLVIVFGSIEATDAIYLKRHLTLAAYEAATELEDPEGTFSHAQTRCGQILNARSIQQFTMTALSSGTYSGTALDDLPPGGEYTVTVTAPVTENSVSPNWFFQGQSVRGTVTMVRSH